MGIQDTKVGDMIMGDIGMGGSLWLDVTKVTKLKIHCKEGDEEFVFSRKTGRCLKNPPMQTCHFGQLCSPETAEMMREQSRKWKTYQQALADAEAMMEMHEGLEPRSALKQAGSDRGIPYGDDMGKFVIWAEKQWGIYKEAV